MKDHIVGRLTSHGHENQKNHFSDEDCGGSHCMWPSSPVPFSSFQGQRVPIRRELPSVRELASWKASDCCSMLIQCVAHPWPKKCYMDDTEVGKIFLFSCHYTSSILLTFIGESGMAWELPVEARNDLCLTAPVQIKVKTLFPRSESNTMPLSVFFSASFPWELICVMRW